MEPRQSLPVLGNVRLCFGSLFKLLAYSDTSSVHLFLSRIATILDFKVPALTRILEFPLDKGVA